MFKLLEIPIICKRRRDELRRLVLGTFILVLSFLLVPHIIVPVHAGEPVLTDVFEYLGFENVQQVIDETFPAGLYEITLYAEFAGYCDENELSYYEVGTDVFTVIFDGEEGGSGYLDPPWTRTFVTDYEFGISMRTPENYRYYTETSRNPDYPEQHAKVYKNLDDSCMFLIGFENLFAEHTDRDYNDMVFSLKLKTPDQVIPEVPIGTVLSFLSMFIAFAGFVGFKRFKH